MRMGGKIARMVVGVFAACFALILLGVGMVWALGWVSGAQVREAVAILRGTGETEKTPTMRGSIEELARQRELLETVTRAREAQEERLKKLQLETERKGSELEGVRQDATRAVAELEAKSRALKEERKAFEAQKSEYERSLASEGLRKLREALEEMDSAKAAEMLYEYDLKTTVRVLGGMRKDGRAAILEAIYDLDRKKGLTDAKGRAGEILRMLGSAPTESGTS